MPLNRARARQLLSEFDFQALFVEEMGWDAVPKERPHPIGDSGYMRRLIVEMSGVTVLEVFPTSPDGTLPDKSDSDKIHTQIAKLSHENVIIFLDDDRNRSKCMLYWAKREDGKRRPRRHHYFKGQPGDLFMSKIDGMVIEMDELREDGSLPISEITYRVAAALDIERVTKRFYSEFSVLRVDFINHIEGIDNDKERFWYASVLLNRLMFIYFLQKKGFIQNNSRYLDDKLGESRSRGSDRYYSEFLDALFFEGFAKPAHERSAEAGDLLGAIPYLNGGLFLRHKLEDDNSDICICIPDKAFDNVLRLFGHYSWHLDDTPGARDNEINPDVLGYIFEKYINQKAFGAYYTRTEITEYLCERSIHSVILAKVNQHSVRLFTDLNELMMRLDGELCILLLDEILPKLSILDPACGSGAFLVAAMKNLLDVYGAIYGRIEVLNDHYLSNELAKIRRNHPSLNYFIRKQIIIDNLYGVDIMDEATEIAKLRLFLALVSSAQKLDDLEPLPNIDFNIMAGNSLIGLLNVDGQRFDDKKQMQYMFQDEIVQSYRAVLDEKNRRVRDYRYATSALPEALQALRKTINEHRREAKKTLDEILLDDFRALEIQYEQAQIKGKAKKRPLETKDIDDLSPFHWGYEFDEIIKTRGGFDVIITNPPWEAFKPQDEDFFAKCDDSIRQKTANRVEKRRRKAQLLEDANIRREYLQYQSEYRHVSAFYRSTPQYKNQISRVNGRKQGTDINLYKLFTEQCANLLRDGGTCGIVIPSGICTDLGTKQLRQMLFDKTAVTGLFGFEKRRKIFEDVDSRFKFVVLSFEKGGRTERFPAAFMRHEVSELDDFPSEDSVEIGVDLIKRSSPSSLSVTEFKNELDVRIVEKMLRFPLLGEKLTNTWNVELSTEFHMTNDSDLFLDDPGPGRLPLYQGRMIWQFKHSYAAPRYWIDEAAGRNRALGRKGVDVGQTLDYQMYRLGFPGIGSSTNERTLIVSILPQNVFAGDMCPNARVINDRTSMSYNAVQLSLCSLWNSFAVDFVLRQKTSTRLSFFYMFQTPIPRLKQGDPFFDSIVRRAAQLICTAPEYDDLAAEVGLGSHHNGVTDPAQRANLRAELDGMIAHIYGLSEDEFAYVLSTFPLVAEPVKAAALDAYRDVECGIVK